MSFFIEDKPKLGGARKRKVWLMFIVIYT